MGSVLVDQDDAVLHLDNNIGFQHFPHDLVVGHREVINILNRVFDRRLRIRCFFFLYRGGYGPGRRRCICGHRRREQGLLHRGSFCRTLRPVDRRVRCVPRALSIVGLFPICRDLRRAWFCHKGRLCGLLPCRHGCRLIGSLRLHRGCGLRFHGLILRQPVGYICRSHRLRLLRRHTVFSVQRLQCRLIEQVENPPFLRELHFRFRRVHVDIHGPGTDLQVNHTGRIAARQQRVSVSLFQRRLQKIRADKASVDKEKLRATVPSACCRRGNEPLQAKPLVRAADRQQCGADLPAQQRVAYGVQISVAGGEEFFLSVPQEAHRDLRSPQRAAQTRLDTGRSLASVGFQEFQPGRGVVEQIPDADAGAGRAAGGLHLVNVAGCQGHICSLRILRSAGIQLDMRHGGDRRQCLSAKAHRLDGFQAVFVVQFGGCVPQKGNPRVLRSHAAAVVGNADHGRAAVADLHRHMLRSGIKGILHQFFDDRCRALDHLAGCDQVGDMRRQQVNLRHGILSFTNLLLNQTVSELKYYNSFSRKGLWFFLLRFSSSYSPLRSCGNAPVSVYGKSPDSCLLFSLFRDKIENL